MAAGRLPIVLAIEDLHYMGADTRALLAELQRRNSHVLVLATSWPEARGRKDFAAWRHGAKDFLTVHTVAEPDPEESVPMVLAFAPKTSDHDARRITEKWSNPFALLSLLSLDRVQTLIDSGQRALEFSEDLLDEPEDVTGLYTARLKEMPSDVARALALAAGGLPSAEADLETSDFIRAVVGRANDKARLVPDSLMAVEARLREATATFAWCRDRGVDVSVFREPSLQLAAYRRWESEQARTRRKEFRSTVVSELEVIINARRGDGLLIPLDDPVAVTACSWLLALAEADPT